MSTRPHEPLTAWLPVLLLALLALGSWYLVRNAPKPPPMGEARPPRHEPDWFMRDFSIQSFDAHSGQLQHQIDGRLLRHYPDTDTLEIDAPRMLSHTEDGHLLRGTARQALSNADGSEIQLRGQARLTREAPADMLQTPQERLQFEGEHLRIWGQQGRVHSDQPVTLLRGADRLSAQSLDYDHKARVLHMRGRVRGTLLP